MLYSWNKKQIGYNGNNLDLEDVYKRQVEFMAALMTSVIDNSAKAAQYLYSCRDMGIKEMCIRDSWYVRRSRERFWAKGMEQDKICLLYTS